MNKKMLCLSALLVFGFSAVAQRTIDQGNCREGESIEYCTQHKKIKELEHTHPALYQQYLTEKQTAAAAKPSTQASEKSGIVYTIPVVFHVLHAGGEENISDEQLYSAIEVLNTDFRLLNPDANNVHADFQGMPADAEIEFALATKAPDGTCFKGITRTFTNLTFNGDDGGDQVEAVIDGNDVYQGQWPPNRYMNVYVCADIGGAAGYTFQPGGWTGGSMYFNGIFVQHTYTGNMGTSSVYTSRTLTHEVGHWLNLDHVWGGDNNPGVASSCGQDDSVNDTPLCIGSTSCNLNLNTCNGDSAYWGFDMRDNVENYMDYSYCSKMYTQGQVTRMRNALTSSTAGRNNLHTASNLALVGADGDLELCKAEFTADKLTVCAGDAVSFSDGSYNAATGWTWTFAGGTPASSTDQNPVVTYATPGTYTVTLVATDGASNDTETKTSYITVLDGSTTLPFYEGFEAYTSLDPASGWYTYNPNTNATFAITTTAAHSGAKSVKLANFNQAGENIDELISSSVDLSGATAGNTTFSFRYSYRRKATSIYERLRVYFTPDCGDNWHMVKNLGGAALSQTVQATAWTPASAADWTTVHIEMTGTTPIGIDYDTFFVDNFRYKFEFEGSDGNNIYLDDINIYAGAPSDEIITAGVDELGAIQGLSLYPNPTENELNLTFNVENSQVVQIQFVDVTGKLVKTTVVNAANGENKVIMNTSELSGGVYFLNVQTANAQQALQFIKR